MNTAQIRVRNAQRPAGSGGSEHEPENVKDVLNLINNSDISSIRSVVSGILEVISNPESSAKDLTDLVETDPPLVTRVLKVANSAYYSPLKTVSEILQAVIMIGFDTLKEIILSQKIGELFQDKGTMDGFSRPLLWKNSVATAVFGKMIFRREFGERGDQMYTAGLLHNIGIIVEHQLLREQLKKALKSAWSEQNNLAVAEKAIFGFDHTELGEAMATDWGFPAELINAMAFHHQPDLVGRENKRIPMTLYMADYICQKRGIGYSDSPYRDQGLYETCLSALSLKEKSVELIADDMNEEMKKMEEKGLFGDE